MSPRSVRRLSSIPSLLVAGSLVLPVGLVAQAQPSIGEPREMSMEIQPVLRNVDDMARALDRLYPALLKDAGIEGVAMVWIHVDELGRVRDARLKETSGYVAFDDAALQVARLMSFEPARNGNAAIPVWISMGINFRSQDGTAPGTAAPAAPQARPGAGARPAPGTAAAEREALAAAPTSTPMTVRPTIVNGAEASEALIAHYPPMLRDAGIGGTVNVWFFIDENGIVQKAQVNESSGYEPLDQAALRVAEIIRFTPARNRDEVVPVWVAMNLTFEVQ